MMVVDREDTLVQKELHWPAYPSLAQIMAPVHCIEDKKNKGFSYIKEKIKKKVL